MNPRKETPINPAIFYDKISDIYESMIDFEKNLELRIDAYKNIFNVPCMVADLGCGIGLDSIALAKNRHSVTAFDISPKMIEATKLNAKKYNMDIDAHVSSIVSIPKKYNGKFDALVCVGNTIAHLDNLNLNKAFIRMNDLLTPGGKLFLHILNYTKIIGEDKRINNIADRDGKTIIRFYDFFKEFIHFNILSFETGKTKQYQLITTKHFPHPQKVIMMALKKSGFTKIKSYGNFSLQKYLPSESKDLFIEAFK